MGIGFAGKELVVHNVGLKCLVADYALNKIYLKGIYL